MSFRIAIILSIIIIQVSLQEELLKMNTCTVQLIMKVVAKLAEGHHTELQVVIYKYERSGHLFHIMKHIVENINNIFYCRKYLDNTGFSYKFYNFTCQTSI